MQSRRRPGVAESKHDRGKPRDRSRGDGAPAARASESSIDPSQLAAALKVPPAALRIGEWLWTTREGAERDLIEELLWSSGPSIRPRLLAPALVASAKPPAQRDGRTELTFARQGFQVGGLARAQAVEALASLLQPALHDAVARTQPAQASTNTRSSQRETALQVTEAAATADAALSADPSRAGMSSDLRYALHVFVPDSAQGNTLSARADALRERLAPPSEQLLDETQLRRQGGLLAQVCLCDADTAALGCMPSEQAQSLWPGGRARMRLGGDFPSRAARKLAEAFAWLGMTPGSGELCVDLGAAPGGWSWLLLEKRARVIAVDPARMDAKLMRNPRLRHVQGNAFDYQPEEPVDWLFCDMAYRPLEVAQMLGRWARRRDTRLLVANFKLPMKRKVEMVERIRGLLAESGFTSLRTRQLYHDREEITLTAHVR